MKKFIKARIIAVLAAMSVSCEQASPPITANNGTNIQKQPPTEKLSDRGEYVPVTDAGTRFRAIQQAQFEAVDGILSTISSYYDEDYIRSINNGAPVYFEDFSTWFDISKTRTITGEYGEEYEISLKDEILDVTQDFLGKFEAIKPSAAEARSLPGAVYSNGMLSFNGDDKIINLNTPAGVLEYDIMMTERENGDMEAFVADVIEVSREASEHGEEHNKDSGERAIYGVELWDAKHNGGVVYYAWGSEKDIKTNIMPEHKAALQDAMKDWEQSVANVGGRIAFVDKTDDYLHQILAYVALTKIRHMFSDNLEEFTSGMADLGGMPGRSRLCLSYNAKNDTASDSDGSYNPANRFQLYRTSRHELGHALGLFHEHQRWDRDDYVYIDFSLNGRHLDANNYGKRPEYQTISLPVPKVRFEAFNIGWFSIWLPVLYIEWIDFSLWKKTESYGGFDYASIMLYGRSQDIRMQKPFMGKKYISWGDAPGNSWNASGIISEDRMFGPEEAYPYNLTPYNIFISEQDARTVKQIYETYHLPW